MRKRGNLSNIRLETERLKPRERTSIRFYRPFRASAVAEKRKNVTLSLNYQAFSTVSRGCKEEGKVVNDLKI